jgi:hypothetical protein
VVNYFQVTRLDPVNHELLTQMRQTYASLPEKDAALAERIRDLDLITRRVFFTSQTFLQGGAWMMLITVSIFLIAFKNMIRWRPQVPELADMPTADKEFLAYAQSRHLITWAGIGLLAGGMMTSYFTESALTAEMVDAATKVASSSDGAAPTGDIPAAPAGKLAQLPWTGQQRGGPFHHRTHHVGRGRGHEHHVEGRSHATRQEFARILGRQALHQRSR